MQLGLVLGYAALILGSYSARFALDLTAVAVLVAGIIWSNLPPIDGSGWLRLNAPLRSKPPMARLQAWLASPPQQNSLVAAILPTGALVYGDLVASGWHSSRMPTAIFGIALGLFNLTAGLAAGSLDAEDPNKTPVSRRLYHTALAVLWLCSAWSTVAISQQAYHLIPQPA